MVKKITMRCAKTPCKVKGCKFYGKRIYNIEKHMERHKAKGEDTVDNYATPRRATMNASEKRKHETCQYPGCPRQGSIYARLTRHVTRFHKITRYQYGELLEMMKKQHIYIMKANKQGVSVKKTSAVDFCPAIEESHPRVKSNSNKRGDGELGADEYIYKAVKVYAKAVRVGTLVHDRYIRSVVRSTEHIRNTSTAKKEEVVFNSSSGNGYEITFKIKKEILDDDHDIAYQKSLNWDEEDGSIKLQKYSSADTKHRNFKDVSAALSKECGDVRYKCSICLEYHKLDIVAGTSVVEL